MQYVHKLLSEGTVSEADVWDVHNRVQTILKDEFDAAKDYQRDDERLRDARNGLSSPAQLSRIRSTGSAPSVPYDKAMTCGL